MRSLGFFLLFTIVIYLTINYANTTYSKDKTKIIVKSVPMPITFYDYFDERSLASNFSEMFGNNLNIRGNETNTQSQEQNKKVFVPQRFFVNI